MVCPLGGSEGHEAEDQDDRWVKWFDRARWVVEKGRKYINPTPLDWLDIARDAVEIAKRSPTHEYFGKGPPFPKKTFAAVLAAKVLEEIGKKTKDKEIGKVWKSLSDEISGVKGVGGTAGTQRSVQKSGGSPKGRSGRRLPTQRELVQAEESFTDSLRESGRRGPRSAGQRERYRFSPSPRAGKARREHKHPPSPHGPTPETKFSKESRAQNQARAETVKAAVVATVR